MMYMVLVLVTAGLAAAGTELTGCPRERVRFEKIMGLRPPGDIEGYLLHKRERYEPVTEACLSKCLASDDCLSFVLFFNVSECYWYRTRPEGLEENDNVIDSGVGWFEKTCSHASDCDKLWVFERIPGATLVGNDAKTLPERMTRSECQEHCLNDTDVLCRCAKFRIYDEPNSTETRGECTLSDTDRHLTPNSYRVSSYNEEYFENQCVNATTNEFCAYEEYENVVLAHVDLEHDGLTKAECEQLCDTTTMFNCRGYSLVPTENVIVINATYKCLIHSEDSKIYGPKSLLHASDARYYEKARCLNITVSCSEKHITVNYQPEINFSGKMYMRGYSESLECYVLGKDKQMITLKIPLFEGQCGITEAKSVNGLNRTLLSGTMILQYNPIIQMQGDRVIKVGCIFTNESKVVLGTGVNFTNMLYPSRGSTIINSSSVQPTVQMRVVDFYSQEEVADTQIGQELQLVIEIKPAEGPYDIWVGHLVAMTEHGEDSILLLDDRGCPTNLKIFPGLTKVINNTTKKLTGNFQAFKFTSSSIVRFSVIVQFCPIYCTPAECGNNVISNGRRKRDIGYPVSENTTSTFIKELNRQQYDNQGRQVIKMPLEFVLRVRNADTLSDRLIYGENNKILVAGYDIIKNEVCFDYSLLLGIIITWVLIQIILVVVCMLMIRRYKKYYRQENTAQSLEELYKNFGLGFSNLEPRRVHWADNGDFT